MTQFLPPNLLSLFLPREPIPYKAPPKKNKCPKSKKYTGIEGFVDYFDPPTEEPPVFIETRYERRERKKREKMEYHMRILEEKRSKWDSKQDPNITSDPYKTLIVARLNYETTEPKLIKEFEIYGPIKNVYIIKNKFTGMPRGYAFIEFEHKRDMHSAYKHMDGKKIDGRRVVVDAERGRTEKHWLPRYLGGGLGSEKRASCHDSTDSHLEQRYKSPSREVRRESEKEKSRSEGRSRDRDRRDSGSRHHKDSESSRGKSSRHRSRSKQSSRSGEKRKKRGENEEYAISSKHKDSRNHERPNYDQNSLSGYERSSKDVYDGVESQERHHY